MGESASFDKTKRLGRVRTQERWLGNQILKSTKYGPGRKTKGAIFPMKCCAGKDCALDGLVTASSTAVNGSRCKQCKGLWHDLCSGKGDQLSFLAERVRVTHGDAIGSKPRIHAVHAGRTVGTHSPCRFAGVSDSRAQAAGHMAHLTTGYVVSGLAHRDLVAERAGLPEHEASSQIAWLCKPPCHAVQHPHRLDHMRHTPRV